MNGKCGDNMKYKRFFTAMLLLTVLGICIQLAGTCILDYVLDFNQTLADEYSKIIGALTQPTNRVIIYTVLLAPVIEEIVFRGGLILLPISLLSGLVYTQNTGNYVSSYKLPVPSKEKVEKKKKFADNIDKYKNRLFIVVLIISSLLFGVYHGNIIQGAYAFAIGMILGTIAYKKNLLASIWLHMVINGMGILINHMFTEQFSPLLKGAITIIAVIIGAISFYCLVFSQGKEKSE